MDTYRLFKNNLILEKYLTIVDIDIFRRALCMFRVSSHNLRIESGRFENIDRLMRICQLCTLKQVENEFHFCLVCPVYQEMRKKFLPSFYYDLPTMTKFTLLMRSQNRDTLLSLSKFLFYSFKKRENLLQTLQ